MKLFGSAVQATAPRANSSAVASWAEIERWTLEACLLRAEGREPEAVGVLEQKLPPLIRDWSAGCGLARPVAQERLRELFRSTQELVARGVVQRRLITAELMARGGAEACTRGARREATPGEALGLRHRVPISDVAGMLDGLAEAEREARRERLWPLRSAATAAAGQL